MHCVVVSVRVVDTIRYDTRCYFNVRSKADISQLNLPHGTDRGQGNFVLPSDARRADSGNRGSSGGTVSGVVVSGDCGVRQ